MPTPQFLQNHSRFFENLLEHRFLFDLGRELVLRDPPQLLGILKAQAVQARLGGALAVS